MPQPSILLLEPGAELRRMIRNVLIRENYDVDPVERPAEAAKRLEAGTHRLLLCALDPLVIDFLRGLRAGTWGRSVAALPVVGMATIVKAGSPSSEGMTPEALKAIAGEVGLAGLIAKPVTIAAVVSRVSAALPVGRRQAATPA